MKINRKNDCKITYFSSNKPLGLAIIAKFKFDVIKMDPIVFKTLTVRHDIVQPFLTTNQIIRRKYIIRSKC